MVSASQGTAARYRYKVQTGARSVGSAEWLEPSDAAGTARRSLHRQQCHEWKENALKRLKPAMLPIVLAFTLGAANADDASHYAAAATFYDTSNAADAASLTKQIVSGMMFRSPELIPHQSVLLDFMLEIIESSEYRELKIRSYMAHLSESQLIELARVFSSEAYQHFRAVQVAMLKESNEGIQQLLRSKEGELARRIEENARRIAPREGRSVPDFFPHGPSVSLQCS